MDPDAVIWQVWGGPSTFRERPGRLGRGQQPVKQLDYRYLPAVGHVYYRVPHPVQAAEEDVGYDRPDLSPLYIGLSCGVWGGMCTISTAPSVSAMYLLMVLPVRAPALSAMMPIFSWRRRRTYSARAGRSAAWQAAGLDSVP